MRIEGQKREKETGEFMQSNNNKTTTEVLSRAVQIEKIEKKEPKTYKRV